MLKEIRLKRGLTQRELSKLTGIHIVTISKIERGIIVAENITLKNAVLLCRALGCTPEELLK